MFQERVEDALDEVPMGRGNPSGQPTCYNMKERYLGRLSYHSMLAVLQPALLVRAFQAPSERST
jgi:hypothetical protein